MDTSSVEVERDPRICPLCDGARFVRVTSDPHDPRFGRAVPCECATREDPAERRARLVRYSRLGALTRLTFNTLVKRGRTNDPGLQTRYGEAVAIAERFASNPEGWLVLTGPHGAGKTHIAAAIANRVIEHGNAALFLTVADLLDHLRSSYGEDAEVDYDELLEQVRTAPVLVLDDLDAYAETPWAREKFFQVVSHRFNAALPTVFTTAKSPADADARIAARLTDPAMSQIVEVGGESAPRYLAIGAMTRDRVAAFTFEEFDPDGLNLDAAQRASLRGAFLKARDWADSPEGWFVLMGGTGCGKTHLAAAIANARLAAGDRVAFVNVPDLLDALRPGREGDAVTLLTTIREVPLLILDDLGAQKSTPWAEEKLYQLLNHRHLARLHTVVTTNQGLGEMEPRIASRLADSDVSRLQEITAPDYRTVGRREFVSRAPSDDAPPPPRSRGRRS
ncbi:MAG: ATP-binding protein [Chloroflexota bacterium]